MPQINERVFWIGYSLIALQVLCAIEDHYFNQSQLRRMGVYHAYSLMQHGGFWCDVFLVTPIAAYVAKNYQLAYLSWWSFLIFAAVVAFVMIAGYFYVKIGDAIPVPYAHDGKTPLAGWVHGIFAVAALWIIGMFYLTPIKPLPSVRDLS